MSDERPAVVVIDHDCLEHLDFRQQHFSEVMDPEVDCSTDRWYEEWWQCTVCGERFTERELRAFQKAEEPLMKEGMKRLSLRAAARCESACKPRCKCRCGGKLHGKNRGEGADFFRALPLEDPHYAVPKRAPKKRQPKQDPVDKPGSLYEGVHG